MFFVSSVVFADQSSITKDKIQNFYNGVVSIDSIVPDEARTSKSLGTVRQGSGVIIDQNNILTIGLSLLKQVK